jgi:hypothetical protein
MAYNKKRDGLHDISHLKTRREHTYCDKKGDMQTVYAK